MVVWVTVSGTVYWTARSEVNDVFDAHLAQSARVLLSLISGELLEEYLSTSEPSEALRAGIEEVNAHLSPHRYETELAFQFSVANGAARFNSASAPFEPLSNDVDGFSDVEVAGTDWRVYTAHDRSGMVVVRVAESSAVRNRLLDELTLKVLVPPVFGMLVLALLAWQSVRVSLAPLSRLADSIRARDPDQFDPLDAAAAQPEVRPIVESLNDLMRRLGRLLENERRFTADAAHELRTPLAGLKAQAQLALRTGSEETRNKALLTIDTAVTHAAHVVDQLLSLARLDTLPVLADTEIDLASVVRDAIALNGAAAQAARITVEAIGPSLCQIRGEHDALLILCRNLIDNAIRFSPQGGTVAVEVRNDGNQVRLVVEDQGPGIPEAERGKVLERFYRRATPEVSGVGLGLSIVRRIVEMHGASMSLDDAATGGLRVTVLFPQAAGEGVDDPI
jgi:two-component system sensor histidine kinase QseC